MALANGKLVIINGESVDSSTEVIVIDISKIEFFKFQTKQIYIQLSSGDPVVLTNLSYNDISQFSEFMNTLVSATENNSIRKIIRIGN